MARRPATDERQAKFFTIPAALEAAAPEGYPARQPKPRRDAKRRPLTGKNQDALGGDSLDTLATRLSPAELEELTAALPDDALAHLTLATVRQLRRRLARSGAHKGGKGRASVLERLPDVRGGQCQGSAQPTSLARPPRFLTR